MAQKLAIYLVAKVKERRTYVIALSKLVDQRWCNYKLTVWKALGVIICSCVLAALFIQIYYFL